MALRGAYIPDGFTDVGNATREALTRGHCSLDEYSMENGFDADSASAFTAASPSDIEAVPSITHAHATSVEACQLYVDIARRF